MFIPDHQIIKLVEDANVIAPFDKQFLGAASYDIEVSHKFASPEMLEVVFITQNGNLRVAEDVSAYNEDTGDYELDTVKIANTHSMYYPEYGVGVLLQPKQVVLCHSTEYVHIPNDMVGMLGVRSSFARKWIDHSSALNLWPGFRGNITFEFTNMGSRPFVLEVGARVLQLAFAQMTAPASNPYTGVYQNQDSQLHSLR